jgi:hypothetical protein
MHKYTQSAFIFWKGKKKNVAVLVIASRHACALQEHGVMWIQISVM